MYAKAVPGFIIPLLSVSFLLGGCYGENESSSDDITDVQYVFSVSAIESEIVTGNLNESRKKEIKVSFLPENSQLYRSGKLPAKLQEKMGADEVYSVEVPELSPPFSVENNQCKDGLIKGDTCTFEIVYKPVSIANDFFKEEDVSMTVGGEPFTWKMLGVPENIQETVASSGASADELPIEVKNTVENSLNYQVWANDTQAQTFGVTLTNNTDDSVSDISITNENPPKGVSYENAKKKSCEKKTECKLDIAFTPGDEDVHEGRMTTFVGDNSFLHFIYKGFRITYNLGSATVYRYGKKFFVNPALDLGNYNQLVNDSRILRTWQHGSVVVTCGDAGLFVSTNGGAVWRHVPLISLVQDFLVRDGHIFISTKNLGLIMGTFDMNTGMISNGKRYSVSNSNLSSNDVRSVMISPSGKYIFIATIKGLMVGKYESATAKVGTKAENGKTQFTIYDQDSIVDLPDNSVTSVAFSEAEKYVLIATRAGLAVGKYDKENGKVSEIKTYRKEEGLPDNFVNQVVVKDENEVLISTLKGLSIALLEEYSKEADKNGKITLLKHYNKFNGLLGDHVKSVTVSGKNVLVSTVDGGVNVLHYKITDEELEEEGLLSSNLPGMFNTVMVTEDSHVWLSGMKNLTRVTFDAEDGSFKNSHVLPGKSLPDPVINSLTLSEDKRLVMATDAGVVLGTFTPDSSDTKFDLPGKEDEDLSLSFGYAVIAGAGLFAGPNSSSGNMLKLFIYNKNTGEVSYNSGSSTPKVNHITTHGNYIYSSTDGEGIKTYDVGDINNPSTLNSGPSMAPSDIGGTKIWSTAIVGDRMLISTDTNGVSVGKFDTSTGKVTGISTFKPCADSGDCRISSVLVPDDESSGFPGKFALISGEKGLYVASYKDSTEASDTANTLGASPNHYTTADQLPDNSVHSTAVIGDKVMIATKGGLAMGDYNKDTGKITNIQAYTLINGLPDKEVRDVVFLEDKYGKRKYALVATGGGLAFTEF